MNGAAGGVGDCCAPAAPANSSVEVASKANAIRVMIVSLYFFQVGGTGSRGSSRDGARHWSRCASMTPFVREVNAFARCGGHGDAASLWDHDHDVGIGHRRE